jgi:hypothetical protein
VLQIAIRRRIWSLASVGAVALALVLWAQAEVSAQAIFRQTLATPGDSRPIVLQADDISTWSDGGKQVFLMKGNVWIEQGATNLRTPQAVVWVDQASKKISGIYNLKVYGENLTLPDGNASRTEKTALLELGTRGEVRIKAYSNKVNQNSMAADALFVRAAAAQKTAEPAPAAAAFPIQGNIVNINPPQAPKVDPNIQLVQSLGPPVVSPIPPDTAPAVPPPPPLGPPANMPSPLSPIIVPPGDGGPKQFNIRPRYNSEPIELKTEAPLATGETPVIVRSPIILTVTDPVTRKVLLDIEADRLCFWTKEKAQDIIGNMSAPQGGTSKSLEFYLSGNVEIYNKSQDETEIIRADEVYYDVNRNVAIALRGDLEIRKKDVPYPIHFKSEELQQLNAKLFLAKQVQVYSSVLPSDPGLTLQVREARIEEYDVIRKNIFGGTVNDPKTGQPMVYKRHSFDGDSDVVRLEGVPIFYTPYLKTTVERPLGPLDSLNFNYNKIFGFQFQSTWDMYELLGLQRPENTRWKLYLDEMTARGPALGTFYETAGRDLFGVNNKYEMALKLYGIYDRGLDILGGNRGQEILISPFPETFVPIEHPDFRGRIFGQLNVQELPLGFSFQAQIAALSDRNFLEQYFPNDFINGPNQDSFLYLKQQNNIWAWSVLADANFQPWMTSTDWLPRADGYVLGLKLFDLLTYDVHGTLGYGQLRPNTVVPNAYQITEQKDYTGLLDLWQDISLPFDVGDVRVVPYANIDLTEFTQDLAGEARGRFYGGAGVRASVPFSRLYPEVQSDVFNVDGIFHKIVVSGNYYYAHSDTGLSQLPQLDQLNDNTSDQALRDIHPWQPILNPANAANLLLNPIFNPQIYALRRLVDTSFNTLDSIDVLQLDLRQRWQTKRGFPGQEHVIDWMTLDVRASIYPQAVRDNFGSAVGDIEYDWVWNIGDRTAIVSNGWFEPIDNGPRVFNLGTYIGRPDKTTFYLGYRQIDPLQSKAIITSVTYAFSAKYALTFASNFDVGNHIQSNTLQLSRIGTDVTFSLGFSYNSIVNTFGLQVEIVPNLVPSTGHGFGPGSSGAFAGR